jgi:hypothetical protein
MWWDIVYKLDVTFETDHVLHFNVVVRSHLIKGDEVHLASEGPGLVHEDFVMYPEICVQFFFELRVVKQNMVLQMNVT